MKRILTSRILFIALLLGVFNSASFAQNDADPALTSMSFGISPLVQGTTTNLTVFFLNNGFTTAIPATKVQLNISLPTSDEYTAFPLGTGALSGTFAGRFNWNYNAATRTFIGINNSAIAAGDGGTISITVKGITPIIAPVISVANIIRISPADYPNENINNNNLTASLAVAPGGPLAVGLLNFTATPKNKVVNLDWQTSSEINSSYFDVEFSIDGTKWNKIGTVTAAGNSTTPTNYSLVHNNPIVGLNYYRLKQVDIDGNFKYSVTRMVKFGAGTSVYLMPNPTADKVYIISNTGGMAQSVSVYSMEGRKLQQIDNYTYGSGIDLSRYAPSTYVLKVTDKQGNTEVFQAVKK